MSRDLHGRRDGLGAKTSDVRTQALARGATPSMNFSFSSGIFTFTQPATVRVTAVLIRVAHFFIAAFPGIWIAMQHTPPWSVASYQELVLSGFSGLFCVLAMQSLGLYGPDMLSNRLLVQRTFLGWTFAFAVLVMVYRLFKVSTDIQDQAVARWYFLTLLMLVLSRFAMLLFFCTRIRRGKFVQYSVILGMNENALHLADDVLSQDDAGSGLLGFIDDRNPSRLPHHSLPLLGGMKALESLVREGKVNQVLVALPPNAHERNSHYAKLLRRLPVQVLLAPDMMIFRVAQKRIQSLAGAPMFVIAELPMQGWASLIKRAEDILLATLALILFSPLMLLVALAVRIESKGPVLFRQRRYGYNHQLIEVFKFRSMYHHMRDQDADVQTGKDDPRVTRAGRFIRRTSLDELPQLFNVLGGSMSLVGPRPHATETKAANILFVDAVEEYVARHRVKPGMTGLAQINGYRGETDTVDKIRKRVEFDLEYIENWSLALDLSILLRTVPAVVSGREAY